MSSRIIYDSEHVRVMHRKGSSPYGVVTFNPATMVVKGDSFWCQAIAEKADLNVIGIMTHRSNWYPDEDMRKVTEIIRPLLAGFEQVIGYGSSMGAYGALKHSRRLGLTHVLAFAPQWSIAPHDVGEWDRRFIHEYRPHLNEDVQIRAHDVIPEPIIFYDPYLEPDRLNVDRIVAAVPQAQIVTAHLVGHYPVGLFKGTNRILSLFESCLTGEIAEIRRQATISRRDPANDLRPRALLDIYIKTNMKAVYRLMDRRPHAFSTGSRAGTNHLLAGLFMAKGELEEAAARSDAAIADLPTVKDFYLRRAAIEENRRDYEAAASFSRMAIARWPKDVSTHLQLASAFLGTGDLAAANEAREAAVAIDPNSPAVALATLKYAQVLGDDEMELSCTKRLVELTPTSQSHSRLAALLTRLNDHAGASESLRHAVAISPNTARFWRLLAESLMKAGRQIEAADALLEAVRLDPEVLGGHRSAVVYESEHLRVIYHVGSSDFALIAFNPATWLASGTNFWCRPIVQKAGITAVGIMTHKSNWYPAEDMKQAITVINRLLQGFKEIIAYGSSMGGYGVLKYGRLLNATRVLSFAPQWSIAPQDVGEWDRRFLSNYRPDLHVDMAIQASDMIEDAFIFYDPFFKDDRLNIQKLVEVNPAARLITAHLTGHFAVAIFAGTAKAMRLFDLCRANDLQGLRRQAASYRRDPKKHTRLRALIDIYLQSNPAAVLRILDQRPDAFGPVERGSVNYQLAAYYVGIEDLEKAAFYCAAAVAEDPNVPEFHMRRSAIEERRENYPVAIAIAEEVVDRWPNHLGAKLKLFEVLMSAGQLAAAEEFLEAASVLDPDCPPVIMARLKVAKEKNDEKAAIRWLSRLVELSPTADSFQRFSAFMTSINKHGDASQALLRLVAMSPNNASYWQMLAGSYLREPRNVKAAEAAEKAIGLAPADPRSYEIAIAGYTRAGMREYAGRNEVALENLLIAKERAEHSTRTATTARRGRSQGWRSMFSVLMRQKPLSARLVS